MAIIIAEGKQSYTDDAGVPLSGGLLYTWDAGTTTPRLTWSDSAQTAPHTNPIVLDARGEATVFWSGAYKVELRTATNVPIWTVDNITAGNDAISAAALAASSGATLVGFTQAGSGITTTVATTLDNVIYDTSFGVVADGVTDDSAAQNAFLAALTARGGVGIMKPGPRLFASQVFIDRLQPKSVTLLGYGVKIKTTHAGSAFQVKNGYDFYATEICGLNVEETANATSLAAFEQMATRNVCWRDCYCSTSGDVVGASYAGFWLHNLTPLDDNSGCFWTYFPGSGVRRTGVAYLNAGVKLQGAANSTHFDGLKLTGVADAIKIVAEVGGSYLSNGVFVTGASIEGVTGNAVRIIGSATALRCPGGIVIANSRFESIAGSVLSMEVCTVSSYRYPDLTLNAIDGTVAPGAVPLVNNPNNLRYSLRYNDETRTEANYMVVANGQIIESLSAANDILELRAANTNSGLSIRDYDGSPTFVWLRRIASAVVELSSYIAGGISLYLAGVGGISATVTRANNLRGVEALAGVATKAVTFGTAETDASYFVQLTPSAANGGCWVTAKGVGGFTINFNAAFTGNVDWFLVR